MSMVKDLVNLLTPYVKDVVPISEYDIRKFASEQKIHLVEEHVQFLMHFGSPSGQRPKIFKWYEGDFDFYSLERVYLENYSDMELPPGTTYFGSNFVGESFCVDHGSGGIFAYDEGCRYGLVHETINGFLLRCLVSVYDEVAFALRVVTRDLEQAYIDDFRLVNAKYKINGAASFDIEYKTVEVPAVIAEYYLISQRLICVHPLTNSIVELHGGVLNDLHT